MANHPDYLIQALGDLVWKDKRECQVVAQRVAEYLQLDTVALKAIECEIGCRIAPARD
jgi:hypothetical protein